MVSVEEGIRVGEPARGRLEDLYERHASSAFRLAYLLTGDRQLAEDLVQEAFLRTFGRFRDLRNPSAFGGYLRTAVVNLARSHFRRRKVERAYLERKRAHPEDHGPAIGTQHEMWEALQALPARQRAALVLRYYEDLTEAQVADVLRCAKGTVKSLTSRGLERLRKEVIPDD